MTNTALTFARPTYARVLAYVMVAGMICFAALFSYVIVDERGGAWLHAIPWGLALVIGVWFAQIASTKLHVDEREIVFTSWLRSWRLSRSDVRGVRDGYAGPKLVAEVASEHVYPRDDNRFAEKLD